MPFGLAKTVRQRKAYPLFAAKVNAERWTSMKKSNTVPV